MYWHKLFTHSVHIYIPEDTHTHARTHLAWILKKIRTSVLSDTPHTLRCSRTHTFTVTVHICVYWQVDEHTPDLIMFINKQHSVWTMSMITLDNPDVDYILNPGCLFDQKQSSDFHQSSSIKTERLTRNWQEVLSWVLGKVVCPPTWIVHSEVHREPTKQKFLTFMLCFLLMKAFKLCRCRGSGSAGFTWQKHWNDKKYWLVSEFENRP